MMLLLLKNHLKRSRPSQLNLTTKNITGITAIFILSVGLLGLMGFVLFQITDSFYRLGLDDVYLKAVFFILLIVLIIYEVVNIIKQLYQNDDNFIYLKLPIKTETVFLSKVIFIYLKQLIVSLLFLSLTAGVYGLVSHQGGGYFVRLIIIGILLPFIPLALASVLSIPVSKLLRIFKKNRTLLTIGLILVLGVFFIGYITFVELILKFIDITAASNNPLIRPEVLEELRTSVQYMQLSKVFYNMLINANFVAFVLNLLIILALLTLLSVGSYFLLKYFYFKTINEQNEKVIITTKHPPKASRPLISIFKKEFKTLSRNPNDAFQAIVMNILMPIFVFFTIKLTSQAGELAVGEEIVPGITILTILIFVLLANGFQGTIISRQKNAYYISKIIPVPMFQQIIFRIGFGYILSILMSTISIIIIVLSGFIGVFQGVFIYVMAIVFLFGYTFNSVASDYKNPQLTANEGGFDEGLNMYNNLLFGLLIAVGLGLINIALPYLLKLFPQMRRFQIMKIFIVDLTAKRVNILLYVVMFVTIISYALFGFFKLRKAVKTA
ncbi:MAG: hypothetical protein WC225_03490 [Acholeplasmataceae bacterium]|nr:hypothetical protein [Acholeplasmataceae bacterium]